MSIEARIQAAIQSALDRADRAIKEFSTPNPTGKHAQD